MCSSEAASFVAVCFVISACARTTNLADSLPKQAEDGGPDASRLLDGAVVTEAGLARCGSQPCACDNGLDDDGDGLVDGLDSECTGPYDMDEATFATGEVKDGNPRCSDCFFDGNAGSGDDGCQVAASCALNGTALDAPRSCNGCTPSGECIDNCLSRTPNGCDCFGCCEVRAGASLVKVLLADSCSLALLDDEQRCPRCIPSSTCRNECGRCELCPGKTPADLPTDCKQPGGAEYTCDEGQACGKSQECTGQSYCVQGCCVPVVL